MRSPFMSPFLTPGGWQEEKWVYWKVSVGSKCVRIVFFFFFFFFVPQIKKKESLLQNLN